MTVYHIAAYISASFVILPIVMGLNCKGLISEYIKPVFYLLFFSLFFDAIGITLNELNINNMFLGYFFTPIEFICIALIYKRFFQVRNKYFTVTISLFISIVIFECFYYGVSHYNSLSTSIESTVLMLFGLSTFYSILKNLTFDHDLLVEPFFYINTAVVTYFSGDLFLFVASSYLQKNSAKQFPELYVLHSVVHLIYYVLIFIAFMVAKKFQLKTGKTFIRLINWE